MSYPLIFGEILYDQFEDGSNVLGGAPFNVAWHLQGFGLHPKIISCIGEDALGQDIMQAIRTWELDSDYIQVDGQHATGTVRVTLQQGQPDFDIVDDVAWDHISYADAIDKLLTKSPALLYHGSLAVRHQTSRDTLLQIRQKINCPVFVDVNMRPPWWSNDMLDLLLTGTSWLKLNGDELAVISECDAHNDAQLWKAARDLIKNYSLDGIIVTLGEKGAFIAGKSDYYRSRPVVVDNLVDAVGAGDGFSSVVIAGLLLGWDHSMILKRAVEFAAEICQQRGAINTEQAFYSGIMSKWSNAEE